MNLLSSNLARASRRYLLRHPWNLWLSVLGIGLGVAVVIAVNLANESARNAFRLSMEAVTGQATHQIVGGPTGIDEMDYARLRTSGALPPAAPVLEGSVRLGDRGLTLLGIDPFADDAFRDGIGGVGDAPVDRLLLEPGALMLPRALAAESRLGIDRTLQLEAAGKTSTAHVAGLFDSDNPAARDSLLIADIATAQELLGRLGRIDRIDLILRPEQIEPLRQRLPTGLRLEPAAARNAATARMTEAFHINLTAMSLLALLVGGFIIYNTMTFSVLQRRTLFGHLRVLGVTRRELFSLILAESLVLGALGTLFGLVAGILIAQGLLHLVTRTINDLYFTLNVTRLFISPPVLLQGALIGLGATLAASLAPAWEAARSEPRDVQRRTRIEGRIGRMLPRLAGVGAALLLIGYAATRLPGQDLLSAFAALFLVIVGFSLCVPLLLLAVNRLLEPILSRVAPPLGRLCARAIARSPSRTGPAVAALTVAVSATVGVGIMIESFRGTVALWLQQTLTSDIYISAPTGASDRSGGSLDPAIEARLGEVSGIGPISRGRSVRIDSEHGETALLAIRMAAHSYRGFRFKGPTAENLWPRFHDGQLILVSEPYAYRHRVEAGDTLRLFTTAGGWRGFEVGGVFHDYGSGQGMLVMDQGVYANLWDDPAVSALGIGLPESADPPQVMAAIRQALAPVDQAYRLRANREIREHSLEVFDQTFAVTQVLRLLAVGVAFIGVLSALLALHLERAREYAILRASGATPGQMAFLVALQSAILGLAAGLLALPLGWMMSDILIDVINLRSFGWTMQTVLPLGVLAQALALALGAALLAGVYPAWHAARTRPADALREE